MFNGTLKVGKEYELNNGEVGECGADGGISFFIVIDGVRLYFQRNGSFNSGPEYHPLSVRGPAVGTLEELDVKPGDVVRHVSYRNGDTGTIEGDLTVNSQGEPCDQESALFAASSPSIFRIISRAEHAKTESPTLFRDMTDAEKGVFLLDIHNGVAVQEFYDGKWTDVDGVNSNDRAYRIKPEPVTETVALHFDAGAKKAMPHKTEQTHTITITMTDGVPPAVSLGDAE